MIFCEPFPLSHSHYYISHLPRVGITSNPLCGVQTPALVSKSSCAACPSVRSCMSPTAVGVSLSNSSPSSKRGAKMSSSTQSLNHLLNFTLPPRQSQSGIPRRSNRKSIGNAKYGVRSTESEQPSLMSDDLIPSWGQRFLYRVCERAVSLRDEPFRRLYRPFCGSRYVS